MDLADRVRPGPLVAYGLQQSKHMLAFTTFFVSNGCAVAGGVRRRPSLALFQELQRQLLMLTIATIATLSFLRVVFCHFDSDPHKLTSSTAHLFTHKH